MTDALWSTIGQVGVQGQVPKSKVEDDGNVANAGVVGSNPLSSTRKSAEAAVVYPVSKSCDSSRPTAGPFSTFESFG